MRGHLALNYITSMERYDKNVHIEQQGLISRVQTR